MCEGRSMREEIGEVCAGRSCNGLENNGKEFGFNRGCDGRLWEDGQQANGMSDFHIHGDYTINYIIRVSFVCLNIFLYF